MRIQLPPMPRAGTIDHYLFFQHRDLDLDCALDKLEILDIYGGSESDYREAEARHQRAYQHAAFRAAIAIRREAGEARARSRLRGGPGRHRQVRRRRDRARSSRRQVIGGAGGGGSGGSGDGSAGDSGASDVPQPLPEMRIGERP